MLQEGFDFNAVDWRRHPYFAENTVTRYYSTVTDKFDEFLRDNPARVVDILKRLSHKLRKATRGYREVCQAVSESVGAHTDEVSATMTYGFEQNEKLKAIHDDVRANTNVSAQGRTDR
jgi:hypothetical protein